jgi:hypothetical protein
VKKIFGLLFILGFSLAATSQVKMQKSEDGLLFTEDGQKVLFYEVKPKSHDGAYERCNYIHPLWGLDGKVLTEDFPADHLHQRGIYWAWHQIWIGDKRIGDGWEIKDYEQDIAEVEFTAKKDGAAVLRTEVYWKSNLWKKAGQKIPYMKENARIIIHPKDGNYRKIDFEIKLLALEENLTIGGSEDVKGYSGFSVRMILPDDVTFMGPEGKITPENTAVKSDGYVNVSGSIGQNGGSGGIVIADNPQNTNYPQPWILRAKNSMQNPVYPGRQPVPVSTTNPLVLKYSLLVYTGKMSSNKIERIIEP